MLNNILLQTDSYKISHWKQYPKGTQNVFSYLEARPKYGENQDVVFFGLQYIIKKYLEGIQVTKEKIDQAEEILNAHLGEGVFNREGWERMLEKHQGRLPIEIKAVPEGSINKRGDVLVTVCNTDPEFYWLTNYVETLLVQVWYPTTVASISYEVKKLIKGYMEETCDNLDGLEFKLHDFGYRGVSSCESAAIGGAGHLVNFLGTDTIAAIELLKEYYEGDVKSLAFSIPASEHSTITSWGRDNENLAMKNMLTQYPKGLVACVSDSFDIYNACENIWGEELRDLMLNRDGTLVVRPDSGDPVEVVIKILEILENKIGATINGKGYKELLPQVRIIWGDGIDPEGIERLLRNMKREGWSTTNIVFGMGGGLLQKLNRDTLSFAFKCSAVYRTSLHPSEEDIPGVPVTKWFDVYKDPVTDLGKASKKGLLSNDKMVTVFKDGVIIKEFDFDSIRENSNV